MSRYVAGLRARIGDDLLLLPTMRWPSSTSVGQLLMAEHVEGGRWSVIGGGVRPDEDPADAARREVAEEVGLDVELRGIVGVYGGPARPRSPCTMRSRSTDRRTAAAPGTVGDRNSGPATPVRPA